MKTTTEQLIDAVKANVVNRLDIASIAGTIDTTDGNIVTEAAHDSLLNAIDMLYDVEAIITKVATDLLIAEVSEDHTN